MLLITLALTDEVIGTGRTERWGRFFTEKKSNGHNSTRRYFTTQRIISYNIVYFYYRNSTQNNDKSTKSKIRYVLRFKGQRSAQKSNEGALAWYRYRFNGCNPSLQAIPAIIIACWFEAMRYTTTKHGKVTCKHILASIVATGFILTVLIFSRCISDIFQRLRLCIKPILLTMFSRWSSDPIKQITINYIMVIWSMVLISFRTPYR